MAKVAFIGLGVMGYPMAGHLARNGHQVTVYNRSPGKAEQWLGSTPAVRRRRRARLRWAPSW